MSALLAACSGDSTRDFGDDRSRTSQPEPDAGRRGSSGTANEDSVSNASGVSTSPLQTALDAGNATASTTSTAVVTRATEASEAPDGGTGLADTSAADAGYLPPKVSNCGDGVYQPDEACDDANTELYDGCDADCQVEPGFECVEFGQPCIAVECGDGVLAQSEGCDDGNAASDDGCPSDCSAPEDGYACPVIGDDCVDVQSCGDGQVQGDEQCDLGQSNSDTGECTTACQYAKCGDGHVQSGEQCDDARLSGAYGTCDEGCVFAPRCGDGKVQSGREVCDEPDGNTGEYGGCTQECQLASHCGDGIVDSDQDEQCDDGDDVEINGCGVSCRFTAGLGVWFAFDEGAGSTAQSRVGDATAEVEYGRRWSRDVPYTDAFVLPEGSTDGYLRLQRLSGVDPTDETQSDPVQYLDLQDLRPSGNRATISMWARRSSTSSAEGLLLWMGSEGDGAGGFEVSDGLWSPNHEIWIRYEGPYSEDPTKYELNMGFAASHAIDITEPAIPQPDPMPEETKCRNAARVTYNDWHHFVLTFKNLQNPDGAGLIRPVAEYTAYVDGQRVSGATECHTVNLSRFRAAFLGRSEFITNAPSWRGEVDNFMMYSRELSESEVSDVYEAQKK